MYSTYAELYEKLFARVPVSLVKIAPIATPEYTYIGTNISGYTLRNREMLKQKRDSFEKKDVYYYSDEAILQNVTPRSRENLVDMFAEDDETRALFEDFAREAQDDVEFKPALESQIGVFLELYLCSFVNCPICGSQLYKYALPFQPVVDLYCNSKTHPINLFQVKSRNIASKSKYFDIPKRTIHVGSYRYGEMVHRIKPSDIIPNTDEYILKSLIGYICIEYELDYDNYRIKVSKDTSYIIIPRVDGLLDTINDFYYYYKNIKPPSSHNIIMFNPNNMHIQNFNQIYEDYFNDTIYLGQQYDLDKATTPFRLNSDLPRRLFHNKYMKYKNKYITLRKQSNIFNNIL